MCGIAGIITSSPGSSQKAAVEKMTSCLSHRGPDGNALWQNANGAATLGHNRLAIIDLSPAGAQPMHYLERYTIVHNGEVYNYQELRSELSAYGYLFSSQSDTEVILAAYDRWKEECLQRFDGMFAFAIWDEKEQKLFAARDRFGEKPFYYSYDGPGNVLYFASEIKALRQHAPAAINGNLLLQYLATGVSSAADQSQTFYKHIAKLPQRHYLLFSPFDDHSVPDIQPYFDLDKQDVATISAENAVQQFREMFFDSVQKRLRSDVEVGTSLSGGLDSSSIAAAIALKGVQVHKAFTASFPLFEKDETAFAASVAGKFNLKHFIVSPSPDDFVSDLQQFVNQHDEPVSSTSVFAQYKVYQLAKQHGVKVVLDGQGADEVLGGYSKYVQWYLQELFNTNKGRFGKEVASFDRRFGFKQKLAAKLPGWTAIQLEKKALRKQRQSFLHPGFVEENLSRESVYKPVVSKLNDILYFDVFGGGLEELLRNADRNAMAHGIEVRLPFLDHKLVQFAFSLPASFKMNDGYGKYLLRRAMDDMLPNEITWRKDKVGFEPPQKTWMAHPRLQELVHEAKKKLVDQHILRPIVLDRPVEPKAAHEADNYDWRFLCAAGMF